jgi:hypothetical protein
VATVTVGIDIGQKRDPTAIAVAELEYRPVPGRGRAEEDHWLIRHLERLPLGTPDPEVAERLLAVIGGIQGRVAGRPPRQVNTLVAGGFGATPASYVVESRPQRATIRVYVDATGVGQPVVDLLAGAGQRVIAVYFTHGDRRVQTGQTVSLGKAYLVSRLQALLQSGRLHLPKTTEAEVLARELLDYEIKIDRDANGTYGAFKVGTHDDLVTAVGLATQATPRQWRAW